MKITRSFSFKAAALLCGIGVVAAALLPDHGQRVHLTDWDKSDHVIAFGTLAILVALALPKTSSIWICGGLAFLGGAIELLQGLPLIHRECSVLDWLADILAIGLGLGIVKIYRLSRKRAETRN